MEKLIKELEEKLKKECSYRDRYKNAEADELHLVYVGRCLELKELIEDLKKSAGKDE